MTATWAARDAGPAEQPGLRQRRRRARGRSGSGSGQSDASRRTRSRNRSRSRSWGARRRRRGRRSRGQVRSGGGGGDGGEDDSRQTGCASFVGSAYSDPTSVPWLVLAMLLGHDWQDRLSYWRGVALHLFRILKWITVLLSIVAIVFCLCYILSVFIYTFSYWWFVPKPEHAWPLYFDYGTQPGQHPTTHVFLSHDARNALRIGQAYDFTVELQMPNSQVNQEAGMFMVSLWLSPNKDTAQETAALHMEAGLLTTTGDLVRVGAGVGGRRPAMLPYRPGIVHALRRVLLAGAYLIGLARDTTTVRVPVMEHVLVQKPGVHWASVTLSAPQLQVAGATLTARTRMQGFTYWMYHWFLSSFVVGTVSLAATMTMCVLLLIFACAWRPICDVVVPELTAAPDMDVHTLDHEDEQGREAEVGLGATGVLGDDALYVDRPQEGSLVYDAALDMEVLRGAAGSASRGGGRVQEDVPEWRRNDDDGDDDDNDGDDEEGEEEARCEGEMSEGEQEERESDD